MEFADILLKRIEGEDNPKSSINALICFSNEDTVKTLGQTIEIMAHHRAGKSYVTLLNLLTPEQASRIGDDNIYKNNLSDIIKSNESGKITLRTFIKPYENDVNSIIQTAEEYDSKIIFMGVDKNVLDARTWANYLKLKNDNLAVEEDFYRELGENSTRVLRDVSTLMNRNDKTTGIFISNSFVSIKKIFVPILKEDDILTLTYIYQLAKNEDISVIVWDAIGIIDNNKKIQKTFSYILRKIDGKIKLWNNNRKITVDLIAEQDLMIIGKAGWDKLIETPLEWISNLPSTLIIRDKKTET